MNSDGKYFIFGGDGDRSFFNERRDIVVSPLDNNQTTSMGGAFAFRVVGGAYDGRLVLLAPRTQIGIETGLAEDGLASVIVHLAPEGFSLNDLRSNQWAIGMSVVFDSSMDWGARGEVGDGNVELPIIGSVRE